MVGSAGAAPLESFIGYGDAPVVDKVCNIVADGSRAARVVDAPYAAEAIRGVVYRTEAQPGGENSSPGPGVSPSPGPGSSPGVSPSPGSSPSPGAGPSITLSLKDVTYLDAATGKWLAISAKNPVAAVTVPVNGITVKNGAAVGADKIQAGEQVRVMTDALPEQKAGGMSVTGWIVIAER